MPQPRSFTLKSPHSISGISRQGDPPPLTPRTAPDSPLTRSQLHDPSQPPPLAPNVTASGICVGVALPGQEVALPTNQAEAQARTATAEWLEHVDAGRIGAKHRD